MLKKVGSIFFTAISILCFIFTNYELGLLFSLLGYTLLLHYVLKIIGYNSVLFLFLVLFGLYGYSVPISVYFELDIGWYRVAKLNTWEKVDSTLYSYMIANQLALLAMGIISLLYVNRNTMSTNSKVEIEQTVKKSYLTLAMISGYTASFFALLDFVRVGMFDAVAKGKAYYQGAVNDLVLNVPYEGFVFISVALFSLFLSSSHFKPGTKIVYIGRYSLSIAFILFVNLITGERGLLVVFGAIFFLGLTIYKRLNIIKLKYIIPIFIIFMLFNVMTLLRESYIKYNGFNTFFKDNKERLYFLMNPANTEFAAAALNYRIFMDLKPNHYNYKYGLSYLEVAIAPIPSYLYLNKPKGILLEFRDEYFPERAKKGSTSGTGFSSLMEAYMNFWYFGPFIVYFLFFFFLVLLENKKRKNQIFIKVFYLLMFNICLIFSRSASQYIMFTFILYLLEISFVTLIYHVFMKNIPFLNNNKLTHGNN